MIKLADDVSLNVSVIGSGRPVLFLHGFTGSTQTWNRQLAHFGPGWRVAALDFLGHGLSVSPTDPKRYQMDRCLQDLSVLMRTLALEGAAVVGYSMGGRVALALAIEYPELVGTLVLESASPGLKSADERAARAAADEALAAVLEREGIVSFVNQWEAQPLWASQASLPVPTKVELRRARLQNNPLGLAASLRGLGIGAQSSYWDRLGGVQAPTLVVTGQLDVKFTGIAALMAHAIPRARLEIVAGAGHSVHLEQPVNFDRLVLEFISQERKSPYGS
jgi:2-succinyl-6-hydroxy-2,4-cyclohexadiene-1-carboxylate synthase